MYTVRQVSKELGVTGQTVRNLVREGKLTAYRVGSQIRFNECELAAYLQQNKITNNTDTTSEKE